MIRRPEGASQREIARFLREAGILQQLRHSKIVAFHEMDRAAEVLYFVRDYVPGTDATKLLKRDGPLAIDRAVRLVCQALEGLHYAHGHGVPPDDAEAAKWYRLAAEQGDAYAQFFLGRMYRGGKGVPQDDAKAAKWYRLSADQGNAYAQFSLGAMYYKGWGVPQDYVQGHFWLNLAASRFPASDAKYRNNAVKIRDNVASSMTPEQIAEAQKLAREWKPK